MNKVSSNKQGIFAIIAALIVLFSALWDPKVSVVVSVGALIIFAVYNFLQK